MPDRDAIADDAGVDFAIDVDDGVVLDAGLVADADVVDIAADGDVGPDAGVFADNDVADDLGAVINESGGADLRHHPAKCSNHGKKRAQLLGCACSVNKVMVASAAVAEGFRLQQVGYGAISKGKTFRGGNV